MFATTEAEFITMAERYLGGKLYEARGVSCCLILPFENTMGAIQLESNLVPNSNLKVYGRTHHFIVELTVNEEK